MDALINVVIPVFGIVLAGYLAGRFSVLGSESAVALNRFVYFFALPALLFAFTARAPLAKVLNWSFIAAFIGAGMLTLCIALLVRRLWFRQDFSTLSMHGLTSVYGNVTYMGVPLLLTAYGPDGVLPTIAATLAINFVFIAGGIAALEAARATGPSTPRVISQVARHAGRQSAVAIFVARDCVLRTRAAAPQSDREFSRSYVRSCRPRSVVRPRSFTRRSKAHGRNCRGALAGCAEARDLSPVGVYFGRQGVCLGPIVGTGCCRALCYAHWGRSLHCRSAVQRARPAGISCDCPLDSNLGVHDIVLVDLAESRLKENGRLAPRHRTDRGLGASEYGVTLTMPEHT